MRWLVQTLASGGRSNHSPVAGPDPFTRDKAGRSVAAEYRRYGLPLRQANTQRVAGWAALASALGDRASGVQPKVFIHTSCTRVIQAIPALQQDPSKPEDVLKALPDEDGSGGDDATEALRYLVATPRVSVGTAVA